MAAEAEVDLRRIQRVRVSIINLQLASPDDEGGQASPADVIPMLLKLDRYERRAYARKMKALHVLIAL
jgi:hypothetical protein